MAILTPDKLFIDPKDEINFIIENVANSEKDKIILIVPQNSILLSSLISVSIVYREFLKLKKLIIIVTEDEFGKNISEKVGFVVVKKVSEITNLLWEDASENKKESLMQLELRKQENLDRILIKDKNEDKDKTEDYNKEEIEDEDYSEQNSIISEDSIEDINQEVDVKISENSESLEETSDNLEQIDEEDTDVQNVEDKELEEALKKYKKPRIDPKITQIGNITIYGGADVLNLKKESDIIGDMKEEGQRINNINSVSDFTGRDFTKFVSKEDSFNGFFSKLNPFKKSPKKLEDEEYKKPIDKKIIGLVLLAILIIFVVGYIIILNLINVDVTIQLKSQDITLSEKIIADSKITDVDLTSNSIPAEKKVESKKSATKQGKATGEGEKGEKSKGIITVYNTTKAEILLSKGTKLAQQGDATKVYALTVDIKIPASKEDEQHILSVGVLEDVSIEAEKFGEAYNIKEENLGTPSIYTFKFEGFSSDSLYGRAFDPVAGGTSQKIKVVSESDVKKVTEEIEKSIKEQGKGLLLGFLPNTFFPIEDSLKFTSTNVLVEPKIGEEVKEDGLFSVSIEGDVSILVIDKSDLMQIVQYLVSKNVNNELTGIGLNSANIKLANVVVSEDKVSFDVGYAGAIQSTIDGNLIKDSIKGKHIKQALNEILELQSVQDARIKYNPSFIPEFLQYIPGETSRINVSTN